MANVGLTNDNYSLMALTKSLKKAYVKSGSGSSLKNIFRAPVVTWMSSHLLSFRSRFSSGEEVSVSIYEQNENVYLCCCPDLKLYIFIVYTINYTNVIQATTFRHYIYIYNI